MTGLDMYLIAAKWIIEAGGRVYVDEMCPVFVDQNDKIVVEKAMKDSLKEK